MCKQKFSLLGFILILSSAVIAFQRSTDPNKPESTVEYRNKADVTNARAQQAAFRTATKAVAGNFTPSLEMKENVDFLLTPALLVQEIISDDLMVTYPSE